MKQSQEMTIQNETHSGTMAVVSAKVQTSIIATIDASAVSADLTRSKWLRAAIAEKLDRDSHVKRKAKR